jgi:ATP-dependent DNA helicase RecG
MAGRPEILWPLFGAVSSLPGVGPKTARLMERLDITRPVDLLFTAPTGMVDRRPRASVADVEDGAVATVEVTVEAHFPPRKPGQPHRVTVRDAGAGFMLVFFRAKPAWPEQTLPVGARRVVSGKVERFDQVRQMTHPDHILAPAAASTLPPFEPIYPLTAGLSSRAMAKAVAGALALTPALPEWLDPTLRGQRRWPAWDEAIARLHAPSDEADLAAAAPARERLAYDELLSHQLTLAIARARARRSSGRPTTGDGALRRAVLAALPYAPTGAQTRAGAEIEADMAAPTRMHRLLQGDVGAGKTLVALLAMLTAVEAGGQAAMMAPTEILARQHAAALTPLAAAAGVRVAVVTGRDDTATRKAALAAAADGDAGIVVGTHALFQSSVQFADLRLAIVDEQHRFGVRQRMDLAGKGKDVDLLVMTATPIPRTLALAGYGDMDISVLDEKPPGRQPIATRLVSMERLPEVIDRLGRALEEGRRVYWVCPLVEESDAVDLTSAETRAARLRERFGDAVRLVHGQMPPEDRDAAMADFSSGRASILVATTVIEVGVDVPEASIMVIEHAERFGLAQLHQLRGRVGRGAAASTCLLLYAAAGATARERLTTLRDTEDGFRIAETDLRLRGPGDLLGAQQSGVPHFSIADLERDTDLMRIARDDARLALSRDETLDGERGRALRALLWLHGRDAALAFLTRG